MLSIGAGLFALYDGSLVEAFPGPSSRDKVWGPPSPIFGTFSLIGVAGDMATPGCGGSSSYTEDATEALSGDLTADSDCFEASVLEIVFVCPET